MDPKRLFILEEMPVPKAIMKLALPTVLSMVVQILYNLTDTFFIGKLNDPYQVAAVAIAMPITMFQMAVAGIFGNGGASYISRLLGQRKYTQAREAATSSLFGCILISIVVGVVGALTGTHLVRLIGASANTAVFASHYVNIILIGSPIVMMNFAMTQLLRAEGAANQAMIGLLIGTGVNIVLDPLFIFGLGMGVSGAAYATVIGNGCGMLWNMRYYLKGKSAVAPKLEYLKMHWETYKQILFIGIPASLGQITASFGSSISYNLASYYGDYHVAAIGVAMRVFTIPIFVFLGIAIGVQPLIGYNFGSKNFKRMKETIRSSLLISLSLAFFGILLFTLLPKQLIMIFIEDPLVVSIGTMVLLAYVFAIPFAAAGMIFMTTLQSMGKALPALIVALSRQGIMYLPALFILNKLQGFEGLVLAMPVADGLTNMLSFTFVYLIFRKMRKVIV